MRKICTQCHKLLDESKYYKGVNYPMGLRSACIYCMSKRYRNNAEIFKAKRKYRYDKNKETILKLAKQYRDTHREKIYLQRKKYRDKYKKEISIRLKIWANSDKGRMVKYLLNLKRKATKLLVDDGTINTDSLVNIWTGFCKICNEKIDRLAKRGQKYHCHLDHIIPLTRGGKHTIENVQWLCAWCNISKSNKLDYVRTKKNNSPE